MRMAPLLPIAFGILLLASCGGDAESPASDPETPQSGEIHPAPSAGDIGDMRVRLASLDGLEIDLVDGFGTGPMGEEVTVLAAYEAVGDFDGDGAPEVAVLVASEPGGSGVFTHLLAVQGGADGPVQVAEKLLGDRQQFHRFEAKGDSLLLELTTHAPTDPLCCPTRRAQQIYVIRDGVWRLWRDNTPSAAPPDIQDGVVRRDSARDQPGPTRTGNS